MANGPNRIAVESVDDPRLADFRDLRNRPAGRASDDTHFIVEGRVITQRLISSDYHIRSVVVQRGRDLTAMAGLEPEVPVYEVSGALIRELAGFDFHRGFLASATRKPYGSLTDFRPDRVSLALVHTNDMENLGSIMRSAAAFGIRQMLLDAKSVDPFSRRAMRVSMGAALAMRFLAMDDPPQDLRDLGGRGVTSLAATLADDSISITELPSVVDLSFGGPPVVLLMGNEAAGLPVEVQRAATHRVTIPMRRGIQSGDLVDSLNVSVATAILIHELTRQSR